MAEITPAMLEAAARKLCEIDGFDPNEQASHFVEGLLWNEYTESAREIVAAALSVADVANVSSGTNADPCRAPLCDCSMGAAERCGRPGGAADPTNANGGE